MCVISRRQFLAKAGLAGLALTACSLVNRCRSVRRKPNIILIMADDLGIETLGCYGATDYQTPALDALAASGIRFTNCYSMPLCTPSRVALMTGLYNHRNYTEFGSLPPGSVTFAHHLKQAGYRTCVAGKWQLAGKVEGARYRGEGMLPAEAGFGDAFHFSRVFKNVFGVSPDAFRKMR